MARNLKTGWVVLATTGSVVQGDEDGRVIPKEWLSDIAETYNTKVYTACIWPEHRRYMNGGKVLAVKMVEATEPELKGEFQLMGIIAPNDWLINANRAGEFTFPSIEVGENYRGTGKFFLRGLGVTDEPASAGVQQLEFSHQGKNESAKVFPGQQFDLSEELETNDSLLRRVFSSFGGSDEPIEPEDDTMTKEQLEALKQDLTNHINTQFSTLKSSMSPAPAEPEGDDKGGDKSEADKGKAPTSENFSVLQEENANLKARVGELEKQFAKLDNEPAGGTQTPPDGEGDGEFIRCL